MILRHVDAAGLMAPPQPLLVAPVDELLLLLRRCQFWRNRGMGRCEAVLEHLFVELLEELLLCFG